jgi:release factor glutamine methyltransferase
MKTLLEIARLSESYLKEKGVVSPRLEAEWLVASLLKIDRLTLYTDSDRPVTDDEQQLLRAALLQRGARVPLQYILGETSFLDCTLSVSESVLIPRPETELLAEKIIQAIPRGCKKIFWDICCGSGAIGIAVKKARPELKVTLSDLSTAALEVARENARKNGVEVEFLEGDLLAPFAGRKADYVVSNPPYVTLEEFEALEPEVKNYEPKGALVAGPTGLEFYERFAEGLPSYLNPEAIVWFELGPPETEKLFENPFWMKPKTEADYAGRARYLTLLQNPLNFK